jgi:ribosome-binding protein aMBF1 (putative translation factor)
MLCSRCGKTIEGDEIKFAREGDFMGKPLCRRCRMQVEEESRQHYREGRIKGDGYSKKDQDTTSVYESRSYAFAGNSWCSRENSTNF